MKLKELTFVCWIVVCKAAVGIVAVSKEKHGVRTTHEWRTCPGPYSPATTYRARIVVDRSKDLQSNSRTPALTASLVAHSLTRHPRSPHSSLSFLFYIELGKLHAYAFHALQSDSVRFAPSRNTSTRNNYDCRETHTERDCGSSGERSVAIVKSPSTDSKHLYFSTSTLRPCVVTNTVWIASISIFLLILLPGADQQIAF